MRPAGGRAAAGSATSALAAGLVAGAASAASLWVLRTAVPGGADRWERTSHAGRTLTLLEGPAYVLGSAAGAALGGGVAPLLATTAAGGFGMLDDLSGDGSSKGLAGHLGALARGEVTTGAVKVLGLAVTGVVVAALTDRSASKPATGAAAALSTLVGGGVIAGTANLFNLLDLRPGRALKVAIALGTGLMSASRGRTVSAAAVGAALGVVRPDLAGESMLGDTGANSVGALLGTSMVQATGLRGRVASLTVLVALTLASERVSFTQVIESTPGLRQLDAWGR